jgi:LPXTG-site transpeptidase (sortase) family protein
MPTPVPPSPVRLAIPLISVNAPIEAVGLTPDGAMEAPEGWWDVGWFRYGPIPGQLGNAVIAGHLDSTTGPAVFWHLRSLGPGDKVQVVMSNHQTLTFAVQQVVSYPYNGAPLDHIFGNASAANLNLITCSGDWDPVNHNYSNRMVVYTRKV